jgi:hypothetical protein
MRAKECGKELTKTPIPTNARHNYGLGEISCNNNGPIGNSYNPNKGQFTSGSGDPIGVTVEEKDAPCKNPTKIEDAEIMCKNSLKMDKGQFGSKKNPSMK